MSENILQQLSRYAQAITLKSSQAQAVFNTSKRNQCVTMHLQQQHIHLYLPNVTIFTERS